MRTVILLLVSIAALPALGDDGAAAQRVRGGATPQECFRAIQDAAAGGEYGPRLDNLTEATVCLIVGQMAYEIERHVLFRTPQYEAALALREKHGLGGYDITGEMQMLASGRRDASLALFGAGAWVEDPAAFLNEADALLNKARQDKIDRVDRDVAEAHAEFAKKRQAARSDAEKELLQEQEERFVELIKESAAEAQAQEKAAEELRRVKSELKNVVIEGDSATAEAVVGTSSGPVYFRRIDGRWFMALSLEEPKIVRPTPHQRALSRLISLGHPTFEGDFENPVGYEHEGERTRGRLTDDDLRLLAGMRSLRKIELIGARGISDEGLAALAALPRLESLALQSSSVTQAGLEQLAPARRLKTLRLANLDLSDEAVEAVRRKLPGCTIDERYFLDPQLDYGGFQVQRDRSRFAILSAQPQAGTAGDDELTDLRREWTPRENPHMKPLARAIQRLEVQVFMDTLFDDLEDHLEDKWWEQYPWLKREAGLPQYAIFAPDSDEPVVLTGKVTAEKLGQALADVVRRKKAQ